MKKFIVNSILCISIIVFIVGLFMVIAGFGAQHDIGYVIDGIGLIIGCIITIGFSYVVQAACIYIEKHEYQTEDNDTRNE